VGSQASSPSTVESEHNLRSKVGFDKGCDQEQGNDQEEEDLAKVGQDE
jgi:hypothetical protein